MTVRRLFPVMAGEGRPSTSSLAVATQVVGGRAKPDHDGWAVLA